jgi:hypothetical protein
MLENGHRTEDDSMEGLSRSVRTTVRWNRLQLNYPGKLVRPTNAT